MERNYISSIIINAFGSLARLLELELLGHLSAPNQIALSDFKQIKTLSVTSAAGVSTHRKPLADIEP
jgi:hypothetical protein